MNHRAFMHEAAAWMLRTALEDADYNVTQAAASIGMSRSHFYRAAAGHGVQVTEPETYPQVLSPEFRRFLGAIGRTQCPPNS